MASPSSLIPAEGQRNNPSPPPPPLQGEGAQDRSAPPLLAGEGAGGRGAETPGRDVLLVGGPDPAAADYARYASRGGGVGVSPACRSLVLFLSPGLTERARADLDALIRQAEERRVE